MKLDRSFAAALDEAGAPGFRGAAAFSDGLGTHDRCLAGLCTPVVDAGPAVTALPRRRASLGRL